MDSNYHWDQLNLGKKAMMALGFWFQMESGLVPTFEIYFEAMRIKKNLFMSPVCEMF